MYYKRKINKIPNNGLTKKTVSSTNPLIEKSLVNCVVTFYPGHNCTAGGDHALVQSCSGTGGQRAEGPVVYVSCTNTPEAPPTIPNNPSGDGGISPDTSLHGASGGTPLELDPLADYPKNWICMNPPTCSELIPYTPILTIPMDGPYNFYTGILSYDQITTLLRFEYNDVKNAIDDFLLENQNENGSYNTDVTDMERETINGFMNGIEVDSGVSYFVDEQPVKIYMGTVSDFKSLLDNSPRGVGKFKGSEAGNYLKSLGETKFNFKQMRPLPTQTGFFNTKKSRYIYTKKGGWIDMAHFMFYAGKAYQYKINNVTNPIGEVVQDGYKQEASDGIVARHSAYSYEDLPSDKFGAEFAVNFFDINSSSTFSEQLANYLNNILNASSPNDAPNFNDTPDLDSKDTRPITNTTTTPIYTK